MTVPVSVPDGIPESGDIRLCLEADLLPDGRFGREVLLLADGQLRVYQETGGAWSLRLDLAFEGLTEARAENLVGGGLLSVKQDDERLEVVRYTSKCVPQFAGAAGVMNRWMAGEDVPLDLRPQERCATCGLPLERGTRVCSLCSGGGRTMLRLVSFLKPVWPQAAVLSLLAFISTALGLAPPYLQKPLMDRVLAPAQPLPVDDRMHMLAILTGVFVAVQVLVHVLGAISGWLSAWLGNRLTHDIRTRLFRHLQFLSLGYFDKQQMGTVISRVNQDTGNLQQFLVWGSQDLAINLLLLLGIGVMLFIMNWKLALVVMLPAPLVAIAAQRFFRFMRRYMRRLFRRWGQVNSILSESLNGLRVVKAFAQEDRVISRFDARSAALAEAGVQAERGWAFVFSGISLLMTLGTMAVWYVGGRMVLFEGMTVGTLIAFITYVGMFYRPLQALSMLMNWFTRSMTAAERIFEVLDTQPETEASRDLQPVERIEGRVEFRDVTFGYEPHRPVLKSVSFRTDGGEMIGLVGHSGAGKSTVINLICRFYQTQEGSVLIDGKPIQEYRMEDLRRQIGLVPQDTFLFSGTIADNIAYARPGATRAEVIRAARIANAHEFIVQKPDGYETLIGEGGQGLSAGEKQRLAIARAVLHDPRILILDEATSSVDVETEKKIQEAIDRLIRGRTTVAIAHRLSTLKNADRLIVLKQGEIMEVGTHDELQTKEDGEFKRLVTMYQEVSRVHAVQR